MMGAGIIVGKSILAMVVVRDRVTSMAGRWIILALSKQSYLWDNCLGQLNFALSVAG